MEDDWEGLGDHLAGLPLFFGGGVGRASPYIFRWSANDFLVLFCSASFQGGDAYLAASSQLVIATIVPYALIFLFSFAKAVFGRVPWPSIAMTIAVGKLSVKTAIRSLLKGGLSSCLTCTFCA